MTLAFFIDQNNEPNGLYFVFNGKKDIVSAIDKAVINKNGKQKIYNLQGCEVKNPQHGIYIVNGKKVVL